MCIEYNRAPVESYAYLPLRLRPLDACFVHGTTVRLRPLDGIQVGVGVDVDSNHTHTYRYVYVRWMPAE